MGSVDSGIGPQFDSRNWKREMCGVVEMRTSVWIRYLKQMFKRQKNFISLQKFDLSYTEDTGVFLVIPKF